MRRLGTARPNRAGNAPPGQSPRRDCSLPPSEQARRTRPPPGLRRRHAMAADRRHACTPGRRPRRKRCPPERCRRWAARFRAADGWQEWCCLSAAPASRPAIAGRQGGWRGVARPDGTLQGYLWSRAVDRLHCSRPAGRGMRALRDFNVAIWGNVSMSEAAYVSWAPCGTACLAMGVSVPPSRPCPLIPRLLVRKLGFWRPAPPAPRVPCPGPRCPGTVQEPRASSRHSRPRNGLGHATTRKSAEPAASVACLQ